ncbi:N-acetyl-gamma-glutamyl-phosphate reductase [uncultured Pseudoteredinibacter sp.]|uniref:N-acetyl-gamma-glutamyl-phosphate reductase n=1 Tax=uncultured Pseudoteredinibacter sp. TaxID=1641701 RepID=UPI00261BEE4B|nr:N-acetyl-gamma-glutamyl-phosphate reductase [uncultured Pseudoteredinibacter sp.]
MIKVGIVGATGYTGAELLRLLVNHPKVEVSMITSRAEKGVAVSSLYPSLRGRCDIAFCEPDVKLLAQCDVVFFATPHGVAQSMMAPLIATGTRVIDLSADFRIKDIDCWEQWYQQVHACPELVEQAVYGLPEVNREQIKSAQLVACPGCYPTATQLALIPLLENGLVDPARLIANAASGVSGAGRQAKVDNLMAEVTDSYKAYAVAGHRHLPEIEQGLRTVQGADQAPAEVTFVPHLLPMIRGIQVTAYAELKTPGAVDLQTLFAERYADESFVDVMPEGSCPQTRWVKGSNQCKIAVYQPQGRNTVVVLSVIDNLCKGASGQAVQNMNLMLGFEEKLGLEQLALLP